MNLLTITNEVLKIKNVSIKCVRILDIVPGPTDLRKGIDGYAHIIQDTFKVTAK